MGDGELLALHDGGVLVKSSSTHVWNDAVVLARERRVQSEANEATVPNDVPVPERDLQSQKRTLNVPSVG